MERVIDARVRLPMASRPADCRTPPREMLEQYDSVLGVTEKNKQTLDDLVEEMDAAGVDHAVLHAEYEYGDGVDAMNEAVAKIVSEHPARFTGVGSVSLNVLRPMQTVRQAREAADLGLVGLNIQPAFFDLAIDDPTLYPVYAAASELGLVVALHTGVNYSRVSALDGERPDRLDRVASHFPQLQLVACHAGWPWVTEMVAVARRHPTVHLEFGGIAPRYIGQDGTGWEVARRMMDNLLARQVLFATDWPVMPMRRCLDEWRAEQLKDTTRTALLGGNAAELWLREHES